MKALNIFVVSLIVSAVCGCGGDGGDNNGSSNNVVQTQDLGESGSYSCWSPSFATASSSAYGSGVVTTTGNPSLDAAISQEIQTQSQFWTNVPATVYVFNEGGPQYQNAYSSPQGYIMLGEYIMLDVAQFDPTQPLLPTAGVLAHEWGHQVQFQNGWQATGSPTAAPTELEADMFSGFYMAYVEAYSGADISGYFDALGSLGNYDFTNPQFHGTPEQRESAAATGYETAAACIQQVNETGQQCDYDDLHNAFVQAVENLGIAYPQSVVGSVIETQKISPTHRPLNALPDLEWIAGIANGHRSLNEKGAIPEISRLSKAQRISLGPR